MSSTLTNIQILRSAVPHKRPDPSFLLDGQLALNYKQDDPGLYAKLQDGSMFKIGPAAYTTTGIAPNQNPGVGGVSGNLLGEEWNDGRAAFYSPIKKFYNGTTWQTLGGWDVDNATGSLTCLKAINISTLEADAIRVNGPAIIDGDVTPNGTTCVHDLGKTSERWKGAYFCSMDLTGSLNVDGDINVGGSGTIALDLSVGKDLTVNGEATFGTSCANDKFTVKSPAFLNCDTEIKGELLLTSNLEVIGDADIKGDVSIGTGCGVTTLTVLSDTTFKCDVQFVTYPITFEHLIISNILDVQGDTILGSDCATSELTVNSVSDFNCLTTFYDEVRVGRGATQPQFTTFGPNYFYKDIESASDLKLDGKGYSAPTLDTDPDNTLTTKKWSEDMALDVVLNQGLWEQTGITVKTRVTGGIVLPNGANATIGMDTNRWSKIYSTDLFSSTLTLTNKGTSAITVDADPDNTLTTKKWSEDMAASAALNKGVWKQTGSTVKTNVVNGIVLPNGSNATIGTTGTRWKAGYFNDVYTNDLHLKNERGDWTMIEEEDVLTLRNNKTGKRYAISMTPYTG